METKEIKKGDVLDAFRTVRINDESARKLFDNIGPLVELAFYIIIGKVEESIFGEVSK